MYWVKVFVKWYHDYVFQMKNLMMSKRSICVALYVFASIGIVILGNLLWRYEQLNENVYFPFIYVFTVIHMTSLFVVFNLRGNFPEETYSFLKVDLLSFVFLFFFFFIEISYTEVGSWRRWLFAVIACFLLFKLWLWVVYGGLSLGLVKKLRNGWDGFADLVKIYVVKHRLVSYLITVALLFVAFGIGYVLWKWGGEGIRPNPALWGNNPQPWGWDLFVPLVFVLMYLLFSAVYFFSVRSDSEVDIRLFMFDIATYLFIPLFFVSELMWEFIADWYILFGVFYLVLLALKSFLLVLYVYNRLILSVRKHLRLLFFSALIIFSLFSGWHTFAISTTGDGPYYLLITHSLVYDHDFDLKNNFDKRDYKNFYWVRNLDKPPYMENFHGEEVIPHYCTLYPFILIPGYVVGGRLGAVMTNVLFATMLLVNLFIVAFMLTRSVFSSFVASWLVTLSSPIFFHVSQLFPEMVGASITMWIVKEIFLLNYRGQHGCVRSRAFEVVLLLVLLSLVRDRFLAVAVVLFLLFLLSFGSVRHKFVVLLLVGGSAVTLLFVGHYIAGGASYWNYMGKSFKFLGSLKMFFSHYYYRLLEHNILGMIFDQELGLLVFSPFYIFSFIGFVFMFRKHKKALVLVAMLLIWNVIVLTVAKGSNWFGGWAAPLRYMVCVIPVLGVPLAFAIKRLKGYFFNTLLTVFVGWSIFVSIFMTFNPYYMYGKWNGTNNLLWLIKKYVHVNFARFLPSSFILGDFYKLSYEWIAVILTVLLIVYLASNRHVSNVGQYWIYPMLSFSVVCFFVIAFWLAGRIPFREIVASAMFHNAGVQYDDKHRWRSLWVMQSNGKLYDYVVLPKGDNTIEIAAAGLRTLDVLPEMAVKLNHRILRVFKLECKKDGRWYERIYRVHFVNSKRGICVIELSFDNLLLDRRKNKAVIAYVYNVRRR